MDLALFNVVGIHFLLKYLHIFFGMLWIGHLYYFNFTQGAAMAQMDAGGKSQIQQKLLPIAMWWFRWGAMWTFITGLAMLHTASYTGYQISSEWGVKILTGSLFGITMWFNVWFIIWPAQKIVIQNAQDVAGGKPANPLAAAAGPRALLASRTNTLFSIPMLFYMVAAGHLQINMEMSNLTLYWSILLVVWAALQFNAMKGKLGPMTSVKGVITSGFGLMVFVYLLMEFVL